MSETLRDLVVSLSLQTDNFTRNIKSVNKQIKEAESAFKLASTGVENFDRSTEGLSSHLSTLERKLSLQREAVEQYQRALEAANSKLAETYNRQQDYAKRLSDAKLAQKALGDQIDRTSDRVDLYTSRLGESDGRTVAAQRTLNALKARYKEASAEVKKLAGQNTALQKSTQNAADAVSQANVNLNNAKAAVKGTETEIAKCNQSLRLAQTNWDAAGNSIEESKAAITTFGKQISLAESRFKLASVGIKDLDTSVKGLSAKLVLLQEKLELQERSVAEYEKALQGAKDKLKAAQDAHDPEKIREASDAVIDAETVLNNAKATVERTRSEIEETTRSLNTAKSAWTAAGKSLEDFGKKCESVSKSLGTAGRVLTTVLTTPNVALGSAAVKASISYESAFASVRKTVDATEEEFADLSDGIKGMSTVVASSADDIAEVVAIAGQLGIENNHLLTFARTMIDLGNSTDIVADQAASTLAKFANIVGMDQSLFGNLGATLVDLGNNYATTESAIMEMSLRLAAAGKQVGLSEAQILGFATALSSVGIEAQMGGSAFSKALVKMEVAAETGGEALDDFAKVSGMTAEQFKVLWDTNPAGAFQAFIEGLARMDEEGMSAIATLQEIGIVEVRLRDTLLRATNAHELFTETQITANAAWEENTALTTEAGKRYSTTESKLTNLKNKAVLFGQTIGDDLNPTIHNLIDGADELLDKFMGLDESQRMQIIKFAAIAAAAGPVLLVFSKVTKGLGNISTSIGKFATAVGKAGGGVKGFISVLSKSPAIWVAIAAATITASVAIYDYASGAKQAREALKGMAETAEDWKNTAAETFYGKSDGLSFFGMSKDNFTRDIQSTEEWMSGLLAVWTDGQKESNEIVNHWTDSFKALTDSTRTELEQMREDAQNAGYTSVSDQLTADIDTLDALDKEIETLLKKRQNGYFSEADQIRLQELIDTREAIEVKYRLSPTDPDGFDTIRQKLGGEVARAHARGQEDADVSVYENAMVASAEGLAAINAEIDAQYDKEYALIQLIEDSTERQAAMDELNARYIEDRRNAALEYAALLADVVMPVWGQEDIQKTAADIDLLTLKLREYSAASDSEKPAILEELNQLTAGMDEGALTEYIAMLMQIQSLLDSGMTEAEVEKLFPEIDFSTALEQIAAIQQFLNSNSTALPGLASMFGEALPEEVLTIATDLDMTGAQARWDEFATNPGAITTDAVIASYQEAQDIIKLQPQVEAFISKYTEVPEGASTAELTPEGLVAYVSAYAEATNGADISGITPDNVTAMVSGYEELASGVDISTLKPDQVTAYIFQYLEKEGVDTAGLKPEGVTAFVMAYEEVTGGALTTSLTPDGITAMVVKYLEAEGVDVSELSPGQVEAIVSAYAEATGCDKSALLESFTAHITAYDDSGAVKPTLSITVGISGYDLIAYRNFVENNPVEVEGIVKLGEAYEDPSDALQDSNVTFWQDGVEVPVTAVPKEILTADKLAVLAEDGTMHVFITPELTGSSEAIEETRESLNTLYTYNDSVFGKKEISEDSPFRYLAVDTFGLIKQQTQALQGMIENDNTFGDLWGLLDGLQINSLEKRLASDFDPTRIGEISAYVAELVTAIQNGEEVAAEDLTQLQMIVEFLTGLQLTGTGENIRAGIAEGMTAAGWDSDAETVATNLETALNMALGIESPSTRVKPVGQFVAAGVGVGLSEYDLSADAATLANNLVNAIGLYLPPTTLSALGTSLAGGLASSMSLYSMVGMGSIIASNVRSAVNASLNATTLRSAGVNAMAGLSAGINAGRSGVISAMRSAARAAVSAAKAELKIKSPSRVFKEDVGAEVMRGFGLGILEETKEQAKIIRNASRYLTTEAREGAISYNTHNSNRTYNQQSSVNLSGNTFYVRDEQDIHSLAIEIAGLTRRQQRGKGLRMA